MRPRSVSRGNAALVPPSAQTSEPGITIILPDDDDTEVTEDFPPQGMPELELARRSSAPSLDATTAVTVPKPRAKSEPWANSEPRTGGTPVVRRNAPITGATAAHTLAFALVVAIVAAVHKCAASGP